MKLSQVFQEHSNRKTSHKRVVAIFMSIVIAVIAFITLFTTLEIESYIFNGLVAIVLTAFGSTAAEKFSPYRAPTTNTQQPPKRNVDMEGQ